MITWRTHEIGLARKDAIVMAKSNVTLTWNSWARVPLDIYLTYNQNLYLSIPASGPRRARVKPEVCYSATSLHSVDGTGTWQNTYIAPPQGRVAWDYIRSVDVPSFRVECVCQWRLGAKFTWRKKLPTVERIRSNNLKSLMPPRGLQEQSSSVQTAVDATTLVLTTLRDAARLTSIPYLQQAAGLAVGIITIIQVQNHSISLVVDLSNDRSLWIDFREFETTKMHINVWQMMHVGWFMPLSYPCVALQIIQPRIFRQSFWIIFGN